MSSEPYRILVTGSRAWDDKEAILVHLGMTIVHGKRLGRHVVIVHGACSSGADKIADEIARKRGIDVEPHPADWGRFGKSAGPRRNAEMVTLGADLCLAFIRDGSKGASNCADLAERAGIETRRFEYYSISEEPVWPEGMYAP